MSPTELKALSHSHPILLYDGVCLLCNGYVKWLLKRDKHEKFRYITLQDAPEIKQMFPNDQNDTVVLLQNGNVLSHSDVGLTIFKSLGGLWSGLSWLLILPKGFRDSIYNWIARNRYRWFGKVESCLLPNPEKRHLFLPI